MVRQRSRDTVPEVAVRRRLHATGVRYRVHAKLEPDLRVRGDIVWGGLKIVVFIDGCYWHGCPIHATAPKANAAWWRQKLDENIARDRRTDAVLTSRDWRVLRFWEHEEPDAVVMTIRNELIERRDTHRRG
ncbi:MAG: DNA mismatch endonuclease Vsr [Pseudonocardiaceae bacterium]|nr:DNA mismatch endonuclease Vsr [Pseudonocardiaceae bacterium]